MSSPSPLVAPEDPTVYPVEERVGEEIIQRWIVELLRPLVARWLDEQGRLAFVGADQFIYFVKHDPHQRVAPDVYVLPGVEPTCLVPSWKTWETGVVPSFAFEVVSKNWGKDYFDVIEKYGAMGVPEVIVFDPHFMRRRDRVRWQRFTPAGGKFRQVEWTNDDRIASSSLGCFLRAVGEGPSLRVRLALKPNGQDLFPTGEEAERQAKEAERQAKEAERQAKEAALSRVTELETELRRRR